VLFHVGFKYSVLTNGWIPDGFELVVATLCLARCFDRRGGRAVALFLGLGFLSWGLGDTVWTIQEVFGSGPVTNFLGPTFWLAFYPLAYVAVLFFMRREVGTLTTPGLLDGAVAALGTAAVCSAFAFHGVFGSSSTLTEATNLAYPIGDLLLLSLVVGCTVMLSGRRTALWVMLIIAFLLNGVGDTFNLFQSSEGHYQLDAVFHALAWPAAGLVVSIAVWLPSRPHDSWVHQKSTGFMLPGLATAAVLGILIVDTVHAVAPIAVGLAVAALITAGIRLIRSAQETPVITNVEVGIEKGEGTMSQLCSVHCDIGALQQSVDSISTGFRRVRSIWRSPRQV
jgi:hypothetical protein